MSDWLALLSLFATYGLTFVVPGGRLHARSRRPQFDPILPKPLPNPKSAHLKLLRGALS